MIAALLEFLTFAIWELFLAFVFYTTGALFLRIISLGKLKPPLTMPKAFRENKEQIEYIEICYFLGFFVCLFLVLFSIGTINLNH